MNIKYISHLSSYFFLTSTIPFFHFLYCLCGAFHTDKKAVFRIRIPTESELNWIWIPLRPWIRIWDPGRFFNFCSSDLDPDLESYSPKGLDPEKNPDPKHWLKARQSTASASISHEIPVVPLKKVPGGKVHDPNISLSLLKARQSLASSLIIS